MNIPCNLLRVFRSSGASAILIAALLPVDIAAQTTPPETATRSATVVAVSSPDLDAELALAKVAEEGDLDLARAREGYRAMVRTFDAMRPRIAEALFRWGSVARRLGRTLEARDAWLRVVEDFGDLPELPDQARNALSEMGVETASIPSKAPRTDTPSPGSPRNALNAEPNSPPVSTEGIPRYGVGSASAGNPGSGVSAGSPSSGFGVAGGELAFRSRPGAGYGLAGSGTPGAGVEATRGLVSSRAVPDFDPVEAELNELRAEAARLRSELRKAQRTERILKEAPNQIPTQLLDDPKLVQSLEEAEQRIERLETELERPKLTAEERDSLEEQKRRAQERLRMKPQLYLDRLETTIRLLTRESDILRSEIQELDERRAQDRAARTKSSASPR